MIDFPYLNEICRETDSRIVLLVVDGLGGLPRPQTGRSELETAHIPNLDALASQSACGVTTPVAPGITPGSGPGHLALFGYDPLKYVIGRGVLEAVGIGMDLGPDDIAIRCNFCTLDSNGILTDRRAGRIPTAESAPLVEQLSNITVPGVEIIVEPVQDYRFVVVIRGDGLGGDVTDTDPQRTGFAPLDPAGRSEVRPAYRAQGRSIHRVRPRHPGKPRRRQHDTDAWLLQATGLARVRRRLQSQPGSGRRLSYVSRDSESARNERDSHRTRL